MAKCSGNQLFHQELYNYTITEVEPLVSECLICCVPDSGCKAIVTCVSCFTSRCLDCASKQVVIQRSDKCPMCNNSHISKDTFTGLLKRVDTGSDMKEKMDYAKYAIVQLGHK